MKKTLLLIVIFSACSKGNDANEFQNYSRIVDRSWRVYEQSQNGILDPGAAGYQQTFIFRADGRVYFSQVNPAHLDTLEFEFQNNDNIKMKKPWMSPTTELSLRIDNLSDSNFHFTITSNQSSDIDFYKTKKL